MKLQDKRMNKEWIALKMSGVLWRYAISTTVSRNEADQEQMNYPHTLIDINQSGYQEEVTGSEGHWYCYLYKQIN